MVGMWGSFVPQNAVAFLGPLETAVGCLAISAGFQGASSLELLNELPCHLKTPVPCQCEPYWESDHANLLTAYGIDSPPIECANTYSYKQCYARSIPSIGKGWEKKYEEDLQCLFDSNYRAKMQDLLNCMDYVYRKLGNENQWKLNIGCDGFNPSILNEIDYGTLDAKLANFRITTLMIFGRFRFPAIGQDTELTKYLKKAWFVISKSSKDPFELPEEFANLDELEELYIEGPVGKLPDMREMNKLWNVTLDMSCTGFDKFSQDFLEFVYYMGDKLKENLKIYLNCTPLKELPVPTEGDNTRLKKLKWSLVLQMYGSGFGDNSDDWVKSVFIGDNKNCESHCCPKDGCKSQDDLITEFNNNRPANVSLDKW